MEERSSPYISANKLGEYMVATPTRRRAIIAEQKRPSEFITTRYRDVRIPIASFFASGASDQSGLDGARDLLLKRPSTTAFQEQDRDQSLQLIDHARACAEHFQDRRISMRLGATSGAMTIGGVNVSVRPELITLGPGRRNVVGIGATKLSLNKTTPPTLVSGTYIAALVHWFVDDALREEGQLAIATLCRIVDVPTGQVFTAPPRFTRKRNDLEAACQEIAGRWATI